MGMDSAVANLAAAIRQARVDAGLTQAELGAFVGASRFAVADLEAGKVTTQLRRLIETLDAVGLELVVEPRSKRLASVDATYTPNKSLEEDVLTLADREPT